MSRASSDLSGEMPAPKSVCAGGLRYLLHFTATCWIDRGICLSAELKSVPPGGGSVFMGFAGGGERLPKSAPTVQAHCSLSLPVRCVHSNNPVERVGQLSRAMNRHCAETMDLGRAPIRLTVKGDQPQAGGPRRGYRRVQWIEKAPAPAREKLTSKEFEPLVSACIIRSSRPSQSHGETGCCSPDEHADAGRVRIPRANGRRRHKWGRRLPVA